MKGKDKAKGEQEINENSQNSSTYNDDAADSDYDLI